MTTLLNEISVIPEHFLLVLDDYHSIDSQAVDQALTFLVEHQPPHMHLVIATREENPKQYRNSNFKMQSSKCETQQRTIGRFAWEGEDGEDHC